MAVGITTNNFLTSFKDYVNKFIKDYNEGLFALVWALLTFGLERLLDKEAFNCPKTSYEDYGIAFFVCPIVMLTLLNWLTMPAEGGYYIWSLCKRCWVPAYHRRGDFFAGFLSAISVGLVAPAAWTFLALLDGQHLVCWELGYQFGDNITNSYLKDRGFGYLTVEQYDHKIYAAKAKSHTASVIFLGSAVVAFCFVIILRRSCLKPFDPDERLPGLCSFEELEAFAARDELDRLLTGGNEFDEFASRASLMQFLVIKERIFYLQDEQKGETDEKKVREIQTEIVEFKELERVLYFWAEWYKLDAKKDFTSLLGDSKNTAKDKARNEYEKRMKELAEKRNKRMKDAKDVVDKYKNPKEESFSSAVVNEALYQSWLLTRLEQQSSYFDLDNLVQRWEKDENIKKEIKRLKQSIEPQLENGFVDSPEVRGRIVASYIMDLYKKQNEFCQTLEQVMEKFRSIFPRTATSDPTLRYVEPDNPMYQHIIDNGGETSTGDPQIPLLYTCAKQWKSEDEKKWEDYLLENHEHSWGWRITGCLKSYCPLQRRKEAEKAAKKEAQRLEKEAKKEAQRKKKEAQRLTIDTVEDGRQLLVNEDKDSD